MPKFTHIGYIQTSAHVWYVASQPHLWHYILHALHTQAIHTLLICSMAGARGKRLDRRSWCQKTLHFKKSGAMHVAAVYSILNWNLASRSHTSAAGQVPCRRITTAAAPEGPQDPR